MLIYDYYITSLATNHSVWSG